jgi:hypothetical protein
MSSPSPYAPPASDLYGRPEPLHSSRPRARRTTIDIGEALRYPFQDPDWLSKAAIIGLMMLVPLIGPFVVLGWKAEVYARVRRGEAGLPGLDLGPQLSAGFRVFVGLFASIFVLVMGILVVHALLMGVGAGVGYLLQTITGSEGGMALGMGMAYLVMAGLHVLMAFGINGLMPELYRRGFGGEMFGLLNPGPSLARVRGRLGLYATAAVGMMICNFAGAMGAFACYIGIFLTMPLGYAAAAHLIAQWTELSGDD